jgi:AcrR family transcriptional regulator
MNAPEPLPATRFLHDIPVVEVLAKKRWSREDWIVYALDAMEHGGLGAVTIEELARSSKRTKGSFYAHFDSRDELLGAMLKAWIEAKTAATMQFDSDLFHNGEFSIEGLLGRIRGGRHTARVNLDIAMREWARMDERAQATVMAHDMRRLNNASAMLLAEFPDARHPQVFAMLLLWIVTGRHLVFTDPKQKALSESFDLAMEAFVRMYKASANKFEVPGAPSWKGQFTPLDAPPGSARKGRRRSKA